MHYKGQLLTFTLMLGTLATSCAPSFAEDKIVGIIWQIGTKGDDGKTGKLKWGPRFRATPDGKVWNSPNQGVPVVIGSWNGDEEKTKMKIDKVPSSMNQDGEGDYEFVLVGKDPKIWQGMFTRQSSGAKIPFLIRLVKD